MVKRNALALIAMEISRFIENKALAVAFLNRELGMDSRFPASKNEKHKKNNNRFLACSA
jgi:hypothetical protein